jgi:sugar lactone lactonase YvrE
MAWSVTRDITTESNYTNTNMLMGPMGMGVPLSSAEYNANFYNVAKQIYQTYADRSPSGVITKVLPVSALETTTTQDLPGELVSLTTNGIPVINTLRLGEINASVNGWNCLVTNTAGTNGIHNNIVLDTAPTTGSRYDLIFLEVFLAELGGTSATISNTANKPTATTIYLYGNTQYAGINATDDISEIDAEINRRWQIQYRIRVVDNVAMDTYVDGVNCTTAVKAWGTNPLASWSGYTAGTGSAYTFQNNFNGNGNYGLYVAGDGSTTAKNILGTVDGYTYAIPLAAVFRRNSGIYDPALNPFGCGMSSSNGNVASGVSGRPDGLFYDQIDFSDILSLRHQCLFDSSISWSELASRNFNRIVRGQSASEYGDGDGLGLAVGARSTYPTYSQEICATASIDAGYRGLTQFDYQRRTFTDKPFTQQTQFTFMGGVAPDGSKPSILSAPIAGTASTITTSGTLPAASYSFKITYTNAYGQTTPSPESTTYTLGASGTVTINSPVVEGNASGWNVYMTNTPGSGWLLQNTSPIPIGTNYARSTPLSGTISPPSSNTTSSTLVIAGDSAGLANGTSTVVCSDGTSTPSTGSLPNNTNILVYDAGTLAAVTGTWSGLNTATATFTPTGGWGGSTTTNGVVAIVGINYPAGNGLPLRPSAMLTQELIQGSNIFNMAQFGVTGITASDNLHLNLPSGTFVDGGGNIYIADTANHRVIKLNSSLVYQGQFGVTGISGADNIHLNYPNSVTVDTSGNIYISDTLNQRIVKLNSGFAYVTQFGVTGITGNDSSHLNTPYQICIDSTQSNLYVADYGNSRIVRLSLAMAFGATPITGVAANGIAIDTSTNLYVTTATYVNKYSSSGTLLLSFGNGTVGSTFYTVTNPSSIVLDSSNYVYFCDTGNQRIMKLNPNFIYVGHMGITGLYATDPGRFNQPTGLSIDTNNQLYVADTNNQRMIKLHQEMGGFDPATRTFSVMSSGAPTDKLKFAYRYKPYQGVIGKQGDNTFSYTLKAITDMKSFATTCGTGGKNASVEDNLNGITVRLPFPATYSGNTTPTNDGEWVEIGGSFNLQNAGAVSPIVSDLTAYWGGNYSQFGGASPNGCQFSDTLSGSQIVISQNTALSVFPTRGVNSLEAYVGSSYPYNGGYDYIGMSYGTNSASIDHITYGYFLAVASGAGSTLPVVDGEVVLVVVAFRVNGTGLAVYTNPSIASAIDIYKLEERPVVYF